MIEATKSCPALWKKPPAMEIPIIETNFGPKALIKYIAARLRTPPAAEYRKTEKPVNSAVMIKRNISIDQTFFPLKVNIAIIITRFGRPILAPGAKAKKGGSELSKSPIIVAVAVNNDT